MTPGKRISLALLTIGASVSLIAFLEFGNGKLLISLCIPVIFGFLFCIKPVPVPEGCGE